MPYDQQMPQQQPGLGTGLAQMAADDQALRPMWLQLQERYAMGEIPQMPDYRQWKMQMLQQMQQMQQQQQPQQRPMMGAPQAPQIEPLI